MLKRDLILSDAEKLTRKANFTREDSARVDSMLRLAEALPATNGNGNHAEPAIASQRPEPDSGEYSRMFRDFMVSGDNQTAYFLAEAYKRDYVPQGVTVDASGGALVPKDFAVSLEASMKQTDPLFTGARLVFTDNGDQCFHPVVDDFEEAVIVPENTVEPDGVTSFNYVSWGKCPRWSTGIVTAPLELIHDSAFDFQTVLAVIFGRRFARGCGKAFVNNIIDNAPSPITSASATAVTGDELLNLMGSVDPIYAAKGVFLMSFDSYIKILQLKGSTGGSYLFPAKIGADGNPELLSRPVFISPTMPNMSADAVAIAYGDPSQFLRREVRGSLRIRVAVEKYIEQGKIGYVGQLRTDGQMILSNQGSPLDTNAPFKTIVQHA